MKKSILCSFPILAALPLPLETLERLSALTGIPLICDGVQETQEKFLAKVREQRRKEFLHFLARVIALHLRDPPSI